MGSENSLMVTETIKFGTETIELGTETIKPGIEIFEFWIEIIEFGINNKSKLGNYSYEVYDTKVTKSLKPKHVLQITGYSFLLSK